MTGSTVNGRNGCGARAGARTLTTLAAPLNGAILRALRDGPRPQAELRRETGHPAQTTLRAQLRKLCDAGTIEKRRRNRFPGVLEYELSDSGRNLLAVIAILERWLEDSPEGPLELGGSAAKAAVRALAEGWSTTMLRALTARPLTLTDVDGVITSLSYPSVERRLAAMRLAGLVDACGTTGRGTPYHVTDWARRGAAPLLAAARWERRHAPGESGPITKLDVETAFLLAAGLGDPPAGATGTCRVTAEVRSGSQRGLAGLLLSFSDGALASRTTKVQEYEPGAWATGSLAAWIDGDPASLELGGDYALARATADWLHGGLASRPVPD